MAWLGGFGEALGKLWGGFGVVLGWLWGGSGFPIGCLAVGFEVALGWLDVALSGLLPGGSKVHLPLELQLHGPNQLWEPGRIRGESPDIHGRVAGDNFHAKTNGGPFVGFVGIVGPGIGKDDLSALPVLEEREVR